MHTLPWLTHLAEPAWQAAEVNPGDTAWLLVSAALVLLMTPGLAFFYGGLVGRSNVLSTIMHSFITICLVSVMWVLWGYSLAFGPDRAGLIGGLEWVGLRGVGGDPNPDYGATVPHQAFMVFQLMFAIITPALITGAFAERLKFKALLLFVLLWSTLVYVPLAHWVWGVGGWMRNLGALDFAGGTVVHIASGVSALVAALVVGTRLGYGKEPKEPHNVPFVVLGAALLWFGWFGFNAGSAISAGALATNAFVVTNTAAAMGALSWMTMSWWLGGSPSVVGAASGAVAGLVAITPASGFVGPMPAIIIGLVAGVLCYLAARWRAGWKRVDDALDVWAVHGVGGTWGAIATGLFASTAINPAGADGLFFGGAGLLWKQVVAVLATWAFAGGMTFVILKVLDRLVGLRVSPQEEEMGLDITQHGEVAYKL
ncbi:MAG: ammonium transporter [Dehalococcoidia bacterium]|nr:ammonium transporter [Dehalococcoidia bacterium]MDW8119683.1 ammonium transporter [Chloroflexota bacterium]